MHIESRDGRKVIVRVYEGDVPVDLTFIFRNHAVFLLKEVRWNERYERLPDLLLAKARTLAEQCFAEKLRRSGVTAR